jgi:hypothetical protein
VNALGNGAANPFLVLYLHDVRHISLGIAGRPRVGDDRGHVGS